MNLSINRFTDIVNRLWMSRKGMWGRDGLGPWN